MYGFTNEHRLYSCSDDHLSWDYYNSSYIEDFEQYNIAKTKCENCGREGKIVSSNGETSLKAIKKFLRNINGDLNFFRDLLLLRSADSEGNRKKSFIIEKLRIDSFLAAVTKILDDKTPLKISDLKINGLDLITLGFEPGPQFKEMLDELLIICSQFPEKNNRETLKQLVLAIYSQKEKKKNGKYTNVSRSV